MAGEFEAIARLASRLGPMAASGGWPVTVGIGDDAAVLGLPVGGGGLVACVDQVVEGTHFVRSLTTLGDAGWKAVARNVSDAAAMGATPVAALCSMVVPPGGGDDVDHVVAGLAEAAERWRCPVIGGDLAGGPVLVVSVTLLASLPRGAAPLLRSGARPGDLVVLTGPVGRGGAGYHRLRDGRPSSDGGCERWYARPEPEVAAGLAARAGGATACIDVSDGLVQDVGHLAGASGVGVLLDAAAVPVADGATLDEALTTGDDYVLVATVGAADLGRMSAAMAGAGLAGPAVVGRCTAAGEGLRVAGWAGPLDGWSHDL